MAFRVGRAMERDEMERDEGIRGLKDMSSLVHGSSLALHRLIVADPTGPLQNPVDASLLTHCVSPDMWGKLCFAMKCYDDVMDEYGDDFGIYVIDLNDDDSDEWIFKAPSLRFSRENFKFGSYCLLGDVMYVFDCCKKVDEGGRRVWRYKLPLSPEIVDRRLDMRDLVEVAPMKYPKLFPVATSTPDGKLLVFTSKIWFHVGKTDEFSFESYDPHKNSWEQLPGLSTRKCSNVHATIRGFAFQNNEPILVILTEFGMFSLDIRLSKDKKQWEPFLASPGGPCPSVPRSGNRNSILVGDNYLLNSSGAFELVGEEPKFFRYPQLPHFGYQYTCSADASVLLNMINKKEGCFFCIMESHIKKDTAIPHTIINMYRFDYQRFKNDLQQRKTKGRLLPGTKLVKSFKFLFRPHRSEESLHPLWFGYIPSGSVSTTY